MTDIFISSLLIHLLSHFSTNLHSMIDIGLEQFINLSHGIGDLKGMIFVYLSIPYIEYFDYFQCSHS